MIIVVQVSTYNLLCFLKIQFDLLQEALNGVELIEIYKMNQSKKILFCTYESSPLMTIRNIRLPHEMLKACHASKDVFAEKIKMNGSD